MEYKPAWSSLFGSAAYDMSPAITAGVVTFFVWETAGTVILVAAVLMGILSLHLLLQTVFVHLRRVYVDEDFIAVTGPLTQTQLRWSEVTSAVLKERQNLMSRTDRILVLGNATMSIPLLFNSSTLSTADEERFLDFVRRKVPLVVEQSKPSI